MKRTAIVPFLLLAISACNESKTPVVMPAGYESAALGRAFKDVRAERPKARLVKEGADVYLQETNRPPLYAHALIWFHDASQGATAPAEDQLTVNRAVFTTLTEDAIHAAARQAARAAPEQITGMRTVQGSRFDKVKAAVVESYGKPATCDPERLSCTWEEQDLQVRLYTLDALDKDGKAVPVALRYLLRRKDAADMPQPAPIELTPEQQVAGAPPPVVDGSNLRFQAPEPIPVPPEYLKKDTTPVMPAPSAPSGQPGLRPLPPIPPPVDVPPVPDAKSVR